MVKVYIGKTKGLLQVLWYRVFMGTYIDVCNYYKLPGPEDNNGNTILETSFRGLMRNRLNFINKKTLL